MSWLRVGMSCIKARVVATSQRMRPTSPKLNPLINLAILSWDLCPHLERKVSNSKISLNWQHLTCPPCPGTCQINLPSHKIPFWQLSFIFLIAEFFNISIFLGFLGFWVFRVIINFGVK